MSTSINLKYSKAQTIRYDDIFAFWDYANEHLFQIETPKITEHSLDAASENAVLAQISLTLSSR